MKPIKLKINTKTQKYSIVIGSNLGSNISKILRENSINFKQCLLVIDKNISKHFISKIKKSLNKKKLYIHFFKANEMNKSFNSTNKILDILLNKNFSREDCVVSIGGGITGDVSGFAASLFKRGLKFINIPTTLLSQVDSSIGGKTGVNTKYGKNLVGSFYQPNLVISDVQFLKTLPKRELICGYCEILKHSLIANKKFYNFLDKNSNKILKLSSPYIEKAIYESCKIKKNVVEKDEKEKGLRKILNFGHTFAHAYEASLGYSKKLNHGEAVILGMQSALSFSLKNNLIQKSDYHSILKHISKANLPSKIKKFFKIRDLNKILSFMAKDKKNNSGDINLVLLKKIGHPIINKQYKKNNINFFWSDITSSELPSSDLMFVRDCLVHLSFDDIKKSVNRIKESQSEYLMSTSFIKIKTNLDIYSADWRPINLEKTPFNFPKPIITINEECNEMNGIYSDKSICLWKIKDLPHFNI